MSGAVQVSTQTARRFVLGRQGLWPGRRWAGRDGTRAAVVACEHLQLDPLVIVARSHDLVLHSRVVDYEPAFFDSLTYEERLFFDWGGWLAVRPMAELPYWRTLMRRHRQTPRMLGMVEQHGEAIEAMRKLLAERGTLTSRDFKAADRRAVKSYRGTKDSSLALYYLWLVGDAMTHRRDGFERVYAPTAAVAPAHLVHEADDADTDRFVARKAVAFAGIGRPGPLSRPLARKVTAAEERAIEQDLVDRGELARVEVDGWPGRHFMVAADLGLLDAVSRGGVPREWAPLDATIDGEVNFLSPLDPVVERKRARDLFEFEYVWEIYKKPEHMQYGRYAMPMLWGDRFAGRVDLRTDRRSKTLVVNGIWLEDAAAARNPDFREALRAATQRTMGFLGTDRVDVAAVVQVPLRRALSALNPKRRAGGR